MAGETKPRAKSLREEFPNATPLTSDEFQQWTTPGQTVRGKFLRMVDGSMGGQIVHLQLKDGRVVAYSAPAALVTALDGVKEGSEVVVRYVGDQQGKSGSTYKNFEAVAL